jgi:hypothetical protein
LEHRERLVGVFEPSPAKAPAVVSQPVEPTLPLGIASSIDHPQRRLPNGLYAGETKGAPFEPALSVRSEEKDQ